MTVESRRAGTGILLMFAAAIPFFVQAETQLSQPWTDRAFISDHGSFNGILVIGVPEEPGAENREKLERTFVGTLEKDNVHSIASLDLLAADAEINEQTVRAAVNGKNIDAVLLTRLFRIEEIDEVQRDDPGTKRSERDFALNLWQDWRNARDYRLDAAVKKRVRVVLENNLYDLDSAKIVWSVQSFSMDPKSAKEIIDSLSQLVTAALKKERLI